MSEPSAFSQSRDIVADLRAFLAEHERTAGDRVDPREPVAVVVDRIHDKFRLGWRD